MEVRKSSRNLSATVALGTVLLATVATLIQSIPNEALAQGAEARREAFEEAKASGKLEEARRKAKAAARETSRLWPDWNSRFNTEMVNFLESRFGIETRNLVGRTFAQVITRDGTQSIRGDGRDCVRCHGDTSLLEELGAQNLVGVPQSDFCSRIPRFLRINRPENHAGHKPDELKHFFSAWRSSFC